MENNLENFDFSNFNNINDLSNFNNLTPDQAAALGGAFGLFAGGMLVASIVIGIAVYIILALALYRISIKTKTNVEHAWFAWVPILNAILMLNIAGLSGWYLLALILVNIIPIIGPIACIAFMVYVWMKISKACKKPDYLGLLILVPIANLILPLYLAFGEKLDGKKK